MAAYIRTLDTNHHLLTTQQQRSRPAAGQDRAGLRPDPHIPAGHPFYLRLGQNGQTCRCRSSTASGALGGADNGAETCTMGFGRASRLPDCRAPASSGTWTQVDPRQPGGRSSRPPPDFVRAYDVAKLGGMTRLSPAVSSTGPRADLSFAPLRRLGEDYGIRCHTFAGWPVAGPLRHHPLYPGHRQPRLPGAAHRLPPECVGGLPVRGPGGPHGQRRRPPRPDP